MQAMREELSELHEKFTDAELDAQASQRQLDALTVQLDDQQTRQQHEFNLHREHLDDLETTLIKLQERHDGRLDVQRAMIEDTREQLRDEHEKQHDKQLQQQILIQGLMQQAKQQRSEMAQMQALIHRQQEQLDVQSRKIEWMLRKLDVAVPLPVDDVVIP